MRESKERERRYTEGSLAVGVEDEADWQAYFDSCEWRDSDRGFHDGEDDSEEIPFQLIEPSLRCRSSRRHRSSAGDGGDGRGANPILAAVCDPGYGWLLPLPGPGCPPDHREYIRPPFRDPRAAVEAGQYTRVTIFLIEKMASLGKTGKTKGKSDGERKWAVRASEETEPERPRGLGRQPDF